MYSQESLHRISDFDGTVTEKNGDSYERTFTELLAKRLNLHLDDFQQMLSDAKDVVRDHPDEYGWKINGRIVAPATGDQTIFIHSASSVVIDELRTSAPHARFLESIRTETLIDELYQRCYPLSEWKFKDGAKDFIEEQNASGKFAIVTNSDPAKVSARLGRLLGEEHTVRIIGNARKYHVESDWPQTTFPDLRRPVYIDRPVYRSILLEFFRNSGHGVVIGDIAELDLLLPLTMGYHGILLQSSHTPQSEILYVRGQTKGSTVESLPDASRYIHEIEHQMVNL
jgi:FMN phosphatase YigB (HAD superfamily)